MGCFHCGNGISWLRRRSDLDFCSDEHRAMYHRIMKAALAKIAAMPVYTGREAAEDSMEAVA